MRRRWKRIFGLIIRLTVNLREYGGTGKKKYWERPFTPQFLFTFFMLSRENKKPSFIFVRSSSLDEEILFCQIHRPISFWHTQLFGQFFPSSKEKSFPSKRNFAKWSLSSQKNL